MKIPKYYLIYYLIVAMLGTLGTPLGTKASSVGVQFLMIQNQSQALNTTPLEYFYGMLAAPTST
jgi:hypothetical protein